MILECFVVHHYTRKLFQETVPDKEIILGDFGNIRLVTVGDAAFPKHAWLLKGYSEDTFDPKQRYFNTKPCSTRVVTEMLMVC